MTLDEIANLIEQGRLEQALDRALKSAPLISEAYIESFIAAAKDTARFLNLAIGEVQFVFDRTNIHAVNAMQQNMLRLVKGFTDQQRDAVRQAILDGIRRGANPREMARAFRDSIGLTARQERAVGAFRRALEQLDPTVLQRALRDKRFDRTLRNALEGKSTLSAPQIDTMVGRYRARMLGYRAVTIARTEALRSTHQGARALYDQAIEQGVLQSQNLTQEWNTAGDDRVRDPQHVPMNGQVQPYGTPFVSGAGNLLRYPGDESAPADEVINCRCALGTRITTLTPATNNP